MRVLLLRAGAFPPLPAAGAGGGNTVTARSIVRLQPLPGLLPSFREALDDRPQGLAVVAWTSRHALEFVFQEAEREGVEDRLRQELSPWVQATLGPATAEALARRGFPVAFQPRTPTAEALAHHLVDVGATRVVLPRSRKGSREFSEVLRAGGIPLTVVEVYSPAPDPRLLALTVKEVREGAYEALAFTSAMEVEVFFSAWEAATGPRTALPGGVRLAALGPVTAAALRRRGHEPEVSAQSRVESLLHLLEGPDLSSGASPR